LSVGGCLVAKQTVKDFGSAPNENKRGKIDIFHIPPIVCDEVSGGYHDAEALGIFVKQLRKKVV